MSALEEFYNRHRVLAYSLALRAAGNPSDAEEIVQEAFVNVWRAANTYRPERSNPRSWLLNIVRHGSIDRLRRRGSRVQSVALEQGIDVADTTDVWREVAANLTGEDVRQALSQLPAEQRETIELGYFKGYTHVEIAERMAVPLGTVKGRMRMGLHKLKSLLESSNAEMAVE